MQIWHLISILFDFAVIVINFATTLTASNFRFWYSSNKQHLYRLDDPVLIIKIYLMTLIWKMQQNVDKILKKAQYFKFTYFTNDIFNIIQMLLTSLLKSREVFS